MFRRAREAGIRWRSPGCCRRPGVTAPIAGTSSLVHVDDAIAAEALTLSADEIAKLEAPYEPIAVKGF